VACHTRQRGGDLNRYRRVFDSDGGKLERRIYAMRADGTELEALTRPESLMSMVTGQSELLVPGGDQPTWSADGLRLFHLTCPIQAACASAVLNLGDRSVDESFVIYDMDLSADGAIGVYGTHYDTNSYGVRAFYTGDLTHTWDAIFGAVPVSQPTISPDAVWVAAAMQCQNEEWPSLWVSPLAVPTGACEGHRVTAAGGASVSNPKWGPANLIAYERATPPRDIAIVSADTGEECVIQGPGDDRNPSWAPLADFARPQ
jgi:hypothetical protein